MCGDVLPDADSQKMAVICLPEQKFENVEPYIVKRQLKENLMKLVRMGATTIAVTELMWKNWVNKKNSFLILFDVLQEEKLFESVTFACSDEISMMHYMSIFEKLFLKMRNGWLWLSLIEIIYEMTKILWLASIFKSLSSVALIHWGFIDYAHWGDCPSLSIHREVLVKQMA